MGWLEEDLRRYENEQVENENYWDSLVDKARSELKFCYKLNEEDLEEVLRDILGDADYDWDDLKWLKEKVMQSKEWEDNQNEKEKSCVSTLWRWKLQL